MKFLLPPSTTVAFRQITRRSVCRRARIWKDGAGSARWMSASSVLRESRTTATEVHSIPHLGGAGGLKQLQLDTRRGPPISDASFKSLGLDPPIVDALKRAFPNVQQPTNVQEILIKEILNGKDVLLTDDTGSGKTFGLVLGLLNKPRVVLEDTDAEGKKVLKRVITSLFIVPHRDLAYQLLHWIELITRQLEPSPPLDSIAKVLVRGSEKPHEKLVEEIKQTPPHILICTPQALLEVYNLDKSALQFETLSTVVVDEVDYLVRTAARKDPKKSFFRAYEKALRKVQMHPGPTREILDIIFAKRKELWENPYEPEEDPERRYNSIEEWRNDVEAEEEIPQLVLSSATLRVHLKNYLFGESGWLNGFNLAKIIARNGVRRAVEDEEDAEDDLVSAENEKRRKKAQKKENHVQHSILVVSDTGVKNVDGAVEGPRSEEREAVREAEEADEEADEVEDYYHEKYDKTPSPFKPVSLEAIAAGFALDVPSVGLLVLPASSPVQRAVYELRQMGVNAHGLDLLQEGRGKAHLLRGGDVVRGNPTLLVANLATTRGLDLPGLSHVFILGIPEGPSVTGRAVDAYLHISGRVGRFGRAGRVVSVVEEAEADKMLLILRRIGQCTIRAIDLECRERQDGDLRLRQSHRG